MFEIKVINRLVQKELNTVVFEYFTASPPQLHTMYV